MSEIMEYVKSRDPHEKEFHQAVGEVMDAVKPVLERNPIYRKVRIAERIVEPERVILFRVPWVDDQGAIQVNRGFRIQMNSAIGPYKGGLRFHPSVNLGILKFLAFEQVFKNALTTLPMGGGKGGSDFNPKGKSDIEVMRFCHSFMSELFRHIGPDTDVPAGDIGVGAREIGFLFGMYKKLRNEFSGVLTGKGLNWGGSLIRPEATGYGAVYFAAEMLATRHAEPGGQGVPGVRLRECGAVHGGEADPAGSEGGHPVGFGRLHLRRGRHQPREAGLRDEPEERAARPHQGVCGEVPCGGLHPIDPAADHNPLWNHKAACAFPSATQNEINGEDARNLMRNGVSLVSEGANMPTTPEGVDIFLEHKILYGPGKAANAGGVSVSGLEMTQNSMRLSWTREEVDKRLQMIMKSIHQAAVDAAAQYGHPGNYVVGANIAGFLKVVDAMLDQGVV